MSTREPNDDSEPGFTEQERITANLRLRSISPGSRFLLGALAFVSPRWRGPVVIVCILVIGYLVLRVGPELVKWIKN